MDERVAQYLCHNSWLFRTTVCGTQSGAEAEESVRRKKEKRKEKKRIEGGEMEKRRKKVGVGGRDSQEGKCG